MEFTKSQTQEQECLKDNFFSLVERINLRGEYFAFYYQQNKEQIKRTRRIRYQSKKLGLGLGLVNGAFGCGTKSDTKTQRDYNHTYYLKQKRKQETINVFVSSLGQHTPIYQKEIYKEKVSDTKTSFEKLRDCGTILKDIQSISNCQVGSYEWKSKGGRPRKLNPLTNAERQKRKRAKANINRPANKWQRLLLKMLDNNRVRIETVAKVPSKAGHALTGWKSWVEKKPIADLMELNGEWGARTGRIVKYYGRKYYFNWLDNDIKKKSGIPDQARQEILKKCINWHKNNKIAYVEGTGGLGTPILSKEPLTDFNINYEKYKPAEILINDRQAQIEGTGKEWNWGKPLIVKNAWGLCQLLNRKEAGWKIEEKDRKKAIKRTASNINLCEQLKLTQKHSELLKEHEPNQLFKVNPTIIKIEKVEMMGRMKDPHIVRTAEFYFFYDGYYSNQNKLWDMVGTTPTLQLKRGTNHLFLNAIY